MIAKDKNSYEYKMWYTSSGKGSGRRKERGPTWLHLEEVSRSSLMVGFRINETRTRYVPLKDVLAWEEKEVA